MHSDRLAENKSKRLVHEQQMEDKLQNQRWFFQRFSWDHYNRQQIQNYKLLIHKDEGSWLNRKEWFGGHSNVQK